MENVPRSKLLDSAVEFRGLSKRFGNVLANAGVDLRVERGTIHGVIGENGAGKSTAMKMLYGLYAPDTGEILIHGQNRRWKSPLDAIRSGIGMVHQHFMLAGPYSALENILLGAEPWVPGSGWLPSMMRPVAKSRARAELKALAAQYGLPVPWDAPVESLPVGVQQRIEILKLLYRKAEILILDEPTAVLTPQEVQDLFSNLKKLKAEGKTIIIITHKLKEVMSFTDRVTVFRAGKVTGEVETSQTDTQHLADLMVGRKVLLSVEVPPAPALGDAVLDLRDLRGGNGKLKGVSIRVRSGEIVGIAGVEGNGQSELIQAILHPSEARCRESGTVSVLGKDVTRFKAAQIKALGVGVIPEDRHADGLLLERSVEENFLLGLHRRPQFSRRGLVQAKALRSAAKQAVHVYDVRPPELDLAIEGLSGGNQQKLIIAREFEGDPQFLIAAQPTRGVDVGAIEFIHKKILDARTSGAGVLLVSSELDEILSLADRILVMFDGKVVGEFARGQATEKELGLRMCGAVA